MGATDKIKGVLQHDKPASGSTKTVFESEKVTVIFVLGGPGVGKGTQSANLVRDYGFTHLSVGDLLRAEKDREGSQYGELIRDYIREGELVPLEVTIKLVENAIRDGLDNPPPATQGWGDGQGRFLIDGFPRSMEQAITFEEEVCPSAFALYLSCTEEIMLERLLIRGETSGREDDNKESAKKRFRTFEETSMPAIDHYKKQNKVVEIDATKTDDEVYADVKREIDAKFAGKGIDPIASAYHST